MSNKKMKEQLLPATTMEKLSPLQHVAEDLIREYKGMVEEVYRAVLELHLVRPGFIFSVFRRRFSIRSEKNVNIIYDEEIEKPLVTLKFQVNPMAFTSELNPHYPDETLINYLKVKLHEIFENLKEASPNVPVQEKDKVEKITD